MVQARQITTKRGFKIVRSGRLRKIVRKFVGTMKKFGNDEICEDSGGGVPGKGLNLF
jgi:hypothetical protein